MKRKLLVTVFAAGAMCLSAIQSQATIIVTNTLWTFEASIPTTGGPHAPEFGSGQATQVGATTRSNPLGNGSQESFAANQWNTGEYFQFQVSTLNNHSLKLEWDQTRSGTGPDDFILRYSTDGIGFSDFANYVVLQESPGNGGNWNAITRIPNYTFNYNLSGLAAINNQANVYFRLTTTDNPGGTGTSRVDNFLVTSSLIPEPSTVLLMSLGGYLVWRRRRAV